MCARVDRQRTGGNLHLQHSGADLNTANGFTLTVPSGSTAVINVYVRLTDSIKNMAMTLNGTDPQHVLYNFSQATSLLLSGISVEGSVLAPLASVNFAGGQFNGTLIANNLTGPGELHQDLFAGTLPVNPTPEPSSLVLAGIAAMGLAAVGIGRLRRAVV